MASRSATALLLLLVACTRGEILTYTQKAETACAQIDRAFTAIPAPSTSASFDVWLSRSAEENERGTERLRALLPDATDREAAGALVEASEEATAGFKDYARAYRAKNERRQKAAVKAIESARARYTAAAQTLGLRNCIPPSPAASGP